MIDAPACNRIVSPMSTATVSLRELRTNLRAVKRKMERHGQITITSRGEPLFVLHPAPAAPPKSAPWPNMPDYYARLLRRQPKPMSEAETRRFHEENRGDC